jgi:hypothetical protein
MAKFKKSPRRTSRSKRFRRRLSKAKPPVEVVAMTIATPFVSPCDNPVWLSPVNYLKDGNYEMAGKSYLLGLTGFNTITGQFEHGVFDAINPFSFNSARYWKMMLYGAVMGKVRKRIVPASSKLIQRVPLIGKYVS